MDTDKPEAAAYDSTDKSPNADPYKETAEALANSKQTPDPCIADAHDCSTDKTTDHRTARLGKTETAYRRPVRTPPVILVFSA